MSKRRPGEPPDPELIAACLDGDESAWRSLIDRYRGLIYSVPLRYGFSADDAADVFQQVSVKLYEKLHLVRDQERLGPWLLTSTSRLCWAQRRGRSSRLVVRGEELDDPPDEQGPLPDDELDALERRRLVWDGMRRLPEGCAKLLERLFLKPGAVSYKEISKELSMSEGSIGPTRQRCLDKLRHALVQMGFQP